MYPNANGSLLVLVEVGVIVPVGVGVSEPVWVAVLDADVVILGDPEELPVELIEELDVIDTELVFVELLVIDIEDVGEIDDDNVILDVLDILIVELYVILGLFVQLDDIVLEIDELELEEEDGIFELELDTVFVRVFVGVFVIELLALIVILELLLEEGLIVKVEVELWVLLLLFVELIVTLLLYDGELEVVQLLLKVGVLLFVELIEFVDVDVTLFELVIDDV